jgi:replicative DNA helicase
MPPHSEEAEMGLLGAALLDWRRVVPVAMERGVKSDDFYLTAPRAIWEAVRALWETSTGIDLLTVGEELKRVGKLEQVGGQTGLERVADACPTVAHAEYYLEIVRDKARLRDAITAAEETLAEAYRGDRAGKEVIGRAAERFASAMPVFDRGLSNEAVLDAAVARWREATKNRGKRPDIGLSLPWREPTEVLCGLDPGLHVLAGRQSSGKTTFMGAIEWHVARHLGKHVLSVTLDSTHEELISRHACREAGVSLPKLRWGFAREGQLRAVEGVKEELKAVGERLRVVSTISDVDDICAMATGLRLQGKLDLLTVDYASVLDAAERLGAKALTDLRVKLVYVTQRLKVLGNTKGLPILLLSQLNDRSGKEEPDSSFLLESGSLERDARSVMLLWQDPDVSEAWDEQTCDAGRVTKKLRPIWFKVDKNKGGPAPVKMPFLLHPHYFMFEPVKEFPSDPVAYLGLHDREKVDGQRVPGLAGLDVELTEFDGGEGGGN